jgi:hypothetical protein
MSPATIAEEAGWARSVVGTSGSQWLAATTIAWVVNPSMITLPEPRGAVKEARELEGEKDEEELRLGQLQWTSYLTPHPSFMVPKSKNLLQPNSYLPPSSDEGLLFSSPRPSPARPWKFPAAAARLEAAAVTRSEPRPPWGPPRAGELRPASR